MKNIKYILFYPFILFFLNCPSERFLSPKNPFSYDSQKAGAEIVEVNDLEVEFAVDVDDLTCINHINICIINESTYISISNNLYLFNLNSKFLSVVNISYVEGIRNISYRNENNTFYLLDELGEDIRIKNLLICDNQFNILKKYYIGQYHDYNPDYSKLNYWNKYNIITIVKENKSNIQKLHEIKITNEDNTVDIVELPYIFFDNPPLYMHLVDDYALLCYNEYKISSKEWWYESKLIVKNVFTGATLEEVNVDYLGLKILRPLTVFYEVPYIWFIAENFENWKLQLIQIKIL